jgi:hypothetical protein
MLALGSGEWNFTLTECIWTWLQGIAAPSSSKLLPDLLPQEKGTFTLVLDLNETLVYSDWKVSLLLSYLMFTSERLVPRMFT